MLLRPKRFRRAPVDPEPGRRVSPVVLALCGLLIGAGAWLALAMGGRSEGPGVPAAQLAAESTGRIAEWVLALSPRSHRLFDQTQADIIERASADIRFRIVYTDDSRRRAMLRELETRGADTREIRWIRSPTGSDPWTCDFFLQGRSADGGSIAYLHHPDHYARAWGPQRASDPHVYLRGLSGIQTIVTRFRGEGGQVVADEDRAFVSHTVLETALAQRDVTSEQDLRTHLEAAWGLPVTWINTAQLDEGRHLDVCLMTAGRRRVVLGSPRLTARLLEASSPRVWERVEREVRAGAAATGINAGAGLSVMLHEQARSAPRQQAFERLRGDLEAHGYSVTEVPFLAFGGRHDPMRLVLSYTNVVQDERDGVHTVYLPSYGVDVLDRHAESAWSKLGYRVVPIRALGAAMHGGSIRCLSQVRKLPGRAGARETP